MDDFLLLIARACIKISHNESYKEKISFAKSVTSFRGALLANKKFYQTLRPLILGELLVHYTLYGNEKAVKTILSINPSLIQKIIPFSRDPIGKVYKSITAYAAALYCYDAQMCYVMKQFMKKLEKGQQFQNYQHNKVFGQNTQSHLEKPKPFDFDPIIRAISDATEQQIKSLQNNTSLIHTSPLDKALLNFRDTFKKVCLQEQHANLEHLVKAYEVYQSDHRLDDWNNNKINLFKREIIGYLQLYLPENVKQAFYQSIFRIVKQGEEIKRLETFKDGTGRTLKILINNNDTISTVAPLAGRFEHMYWGNSRGSCKKNHLFFSYAQKKHSAMLDIIGYTEESVTKSNTC